MSGLPWFVHRRRPHACPDPPVSVEPVAVPAGCKYGLYFDPLDDLEPIAGSAFSEIVTNADDTVSFKTQSGKYLSQEPLQRGVFHLADGIGLYEKFGLSGNVAYAWTRPEQGDPIYAYVVARVPNAG
jgi:hypothetical protein